MESQSLIEFGRALMIFMATNMTGEGLKDGYQICSPVPESNKTICMTIPREEFCTFPKQ